MVIRSLPKPSYSSPQLAAQFEPYGGRARWLSAAGEAVDDANDDCVGLIAGRHHEHAVALADDDAAQSGKPALVQLGVDSRINPAHSHATFERRVARRDALGDEGLTRCRVGWLDLFHEGRQNRIFEGFGFHVARAP